MNDITLTFSGPCDETGKIQLPKYARKEIAAAFTGMNVEVQVKRKRKTRSTAQNDYYWGVIVPRVLYALNDINGTTMQSSNKEHSELIHAFLKAKFLPPVVMSDATGQAMELPPSTKRLTTVEMMNYIDDVRAWALEFLDIDIPEPGAQGQFEFGE